MSEKSSFAVNYKLLGMMVAAASLAIAAASYFWPRSAHDPSIVANRFGSVQTGLRSSSARTNAGPATIVAPSGGVSVSSVNQSGGVTVDTVDDERRSR